MKTVFEGKVNDQVFDNVVEYNDALVKALNEGKCVNASSHTYSVEETEQVDQDIDQEPESQSFFYGNVNGEEFDDVNSYNEAIQKLLDAGEDVNAYTETRTGKFAAETEVEEENENAFDWFPGMDKDNYYMDSTFSDNDEAKRVFIGWKEYLNENFTVFKNQVLPHMEPDELDEFYKDLIDAVKQIAHDKDVTNELLNNRQSVLKTIKSDKERLISSLEAFNMKMDESMMNNINVKEDTINDEINLFNNCLTLNGLFGNYYNEILKNVENVNNKTSVENERKNNIKRLVQEIFPEWK